MDSIMMVSVICNAFNHGKYIRDALEGFVMQKTSFPFEVLVHDDASTDNTAEIIREYEERYPDIIKPIYQTENQHSQRVPITRTFQIPRATGKYIATCEGDDYWTDPLKLQKQVDFLEQNPEYSMCACSTVWLNMQTGKVHRVAKTDIDKDVTMEDLILEKKGRVFQYATILMKSEVYKTMPEWTREFRVGDLPLILYAAVCGKVRMLADTMAVYRYQAAGSWTAKIRDNPDYKVSMFEGTIRGYTAFNEATEYQYNDLVSLRIRLHKYKIALVKRDLKALRADELKDIFYAKDLPHRISDILECKAPKLQAAVQRLIQIIRK